MPEDMTNIIRLAIPLTAMFFVVKLMFWAAKRLLEQPIVVVPFEKAIPVENANGMSKGMAMGAGLGLLMGNPFLGIWLGAIFGSGLSKNTESDEGEK